MSRISDLFSLEHTIAGDVFKGCSYPHEVLEGIKDFILKIGATLSKESFYCLKDGVWIAKSATVASNTCINAPCIIDEGAEIRYGAFIRGNAVIGKNAVVGNSTELKNVILFDGVQVPHYNYVGDSIIGYKSHLGAGAITSNVKMDKSLVCVSYGDERFCTGFKKLGAIIGDFVEVGCGSVLNPGTVVGKNTNIYPLSSVRGYVKENSIFKSENAIYSKLPYGIEKE